MTIPPLDTFPPEYAELTLCELLERYTGPNALPLPAELRPWVTAALKVAELVDLEHEIAELERRST